MAVSKRDIKLVKRIICDQSKRDHQDLKEIIPINDRSFRVCFYEGDRIVKVSKQGGRRSIEKELTIYDTIKEQKIPIPVIESYGFDELREKAFLVMDDAGEKTVFELQQARYPYLEQLYRDMGEVMAKIHGLHFSESGEFTDKGVVPHNLDGHLQKAHGLAGWAVEREFIGQDELAAFKDYLMPTVDGFSLCHNDFNPANCVVKNDKINAVVDWEDAWIGNNLIDLALTHAYLDYSCPVELTRAFLAGYHSVNEIPREYEHDYMPVRMAQVLGMMKEWDRQGLAANMPRAVNLFRLYGESC